MPSNIDIAKKLDTACLAKDFATVKTLLHPKYSFKDPMMQVNSAQEMIEMMQNCPFECRIENVNFVSEGNKVVEIFDSVMTAPVSFRQHICCVMTFENGKVRSGEMFYDTAEIPKEAKELMERSFKQKKAA